MLRIRVDDQPTSATFNIEGKLVGNSVDELRKVWTAIRSQTPEKSTVVDLSSVLVVDSAGRALLRQMHAKGSRIVGSGLMTRTLIQEIADGKTNPGDSAFLLTTEKL
jgi:ABC-type transporter Mla MlaB component